MTTKLWTAATLLFALSWQLVKEHAFYSDETLCGFRCLSRDPDWITLQELYAEDAYPGGVYLSTPFGRMRYYHLRPPGDPLINGSRIVLIHGIGHPSIVFHLLVPSLVVAGHEVLVYDQFGRGYSDAPSARYDEAFMLDQLAWLLNDVGWTRTKKAVTMVGYRRNGFVGKGGAIATAYAATYPDQISRLILLSPAGLLDRLPLVGQVASVPVLNDLLVVSGLAAHIMKRASNDNFLLPALDKEQERLAYAHQENLRLGLKSDLNDTILALESVLRLIRLNSLQIDRHAGMMRSFFSTTRYFPFTRGSRMGKYYERVGMGADGFPIHVLWGTHDRLISFHLWQHLHRLIPRAQLYPLSHAGHSIVTENATAVSNILVDILSSTK